jgi:hypothetical protein
MAPEAIAIDVLPRHVLQFLDEKQTAKTARTRGKLFVSVCSSDHELRGALIDACSTFGFEAEECPDLSVETGERRELARSPNIPPRVTLWDVPVLENGWHQAMERLSLSGPIIALLGFADRATVALARANGAAACLGIPFDLDDLGFVLDRIDKELGNDQSLADQESVRPELPHMLPPPPASRVSRSPRAMRGREFMMPLWSNEGTPPRIDSDRSF